MPSPRRLLALALVVPVLGLAACGGSHSGSGAKQGTQTTKSRPGY